MAGSPTLRLVPPEGGRRRMVRAELLGSHTHETVNGRRVHVWRRGDTLLARGRWQGRAFSEVLGADTRQAASRLRKLLGEIEDRSYVPPSARPRQLVRDRRHVRLTVRQLADEFLQAKRSERGQQTAANYRARLRPVLAFADQAGVRARWPEAASLDAEFVRELRSYLMTCTTSRNGRSGGRQRPLSSTQVRQALETLRAVFNWAVDPVNARLPAGTTSPFGRGAVPAKPPKDPLRDDYLPLDLRVRLVGLMDEWQLCHLAWSLVLPLRPDEAEGLLVGDVDAGKGWLQFGRRFSDCNFTKARTGFVVPYPPEFAPLLARCVQGRAEGPLLRSRRAFGRAQGSDSGSEDALRRSYQEALVAAGRGRVLSDHDRKLVFRDVLRRRWGGVSKDRLAAEFKDLVRGGAGSSG